jgi:hypothetical protein
VRTPAISVLFLVASVASASTADFSGRTGTHAAGVEATIQRDAAMAAAQAEVVAGERVESGLGVGAGHEPTTQRTNPMASLKVQVRVDEISAKVTGATSVAKAIRDETKVEVQNIR